MAENLAFNKCSINDMGRVSELANRIWPLTFSEILTQEQIVYMLDWMYSLDTLKQQVLSGHLFYIAKLGEKEIGFVGLEPNYPKNGYLRIHKIYLHPEYHGKKIGKWMMDKIQEIALELKMQNLHLNVNRHNAAVKFYLKSGFETIKSEDIEIGNGYFMNDFVMQKSLTPAT